MCSIREGLVRCCCMLMRVDSNTMTIELAEELRPLVRQYDDKLQIQSTFLSEKEIMERYLKHGYGNEYNFDQIERLDMPT